MLYVMSCIGFMMMTCVCSFKKHGPYLSRVAQLWGNWNNSPPSLRWEVPSKNFGWKLSDSVPSPHTMVLDGWSWYSCRWFWSDYVLATSSINVRTVGMWASGVGTSHTFGDPWRCCPSLDPIPGGKGCGNPHEHHSFQAKKHSPQSLFAFLMSSGETDQEPFSEPCVETFGLVVQCLLWGLQPKCWTFGGAPDW